MRYYAIQIIAADGSVLVPNPQTGKFETSAPASPATLLPNQLQVPAVNNGAPQYTYTSYVNGKTLPGALNIEFNIPIAGYATPYGNAWLRIWGVPLAQIGQSANLSNLEIAISAGMQKGLPLAKPQQAGLIMRGTIFQAFGNWHGTDMTLDLVLYPDGGTEANPKNIVLNWLGGVPLQQALAATLQTAFPNYKQVFAISPNLVLNYNEAHFVATLTQLTQWLKQRTQPIIGGTYEGVNIVIKDKTITVFDGTADFGSTTLAKPTQIAFEDMIGQPTWIDTATIQIQTTLRADLNIGDYIQLPPGIGSPFAIVPANLTVGANPIPRNVTTFASVFQIIALYHYGNYRQADAASWNTTVNAVYLPGNGPPGAP